MRVLQVVTLISPDGAYGGPVRVSFNQTRHLAADNDVRVLGATRGYSTRLNELEGTPVRLTKPWQLVPFMGFAGLASPGMLWWMIRHRSTFDVVHVHLARDLVTLPAALLALIMRKRVVVQTHGMIIESNRLSAPIMDRFLTRPVLRRASAVFYLSESEKRDILRVEPHLALVHLPNGVPSYDVRDDKDRHGVEVLYLARLHERKRPRLFVAAAAELLSNGVDATFRLVGPDNGEGADVSRAIASAADERIAYEGALQPTETVDRMMRASIYVLPSINEPFPMSVLEAMSIGLPVIVTESCGLADFVSTTGSGIVADDTKQSLVDAMRTLIEDPSLRRQMGAAARQTIVADFSMEAVGRRLVSAYRAESVGATDEEIRG